jgi:hypothetical protein
LLVEHHRQLGRSHGQATPTGLGQRQFAINQLGQKGPLEILPLGGGKGLPRLESPGEGGGELGLADLPVIDLKQGARCGDRFGTAAAQQTSRQQTGQVTQ